MAGKSTGAVVVKQRQKGTVYSLRFTAYGARRFITLGASADGWDRERAETELANVLADVRRGIWQPPVPVPVPVIEAPQEEPTFHVFASEWLCAREAEGLSERTVTDLRWSLVGHLL